MRNVECGARNVARKNQEGRHDESANFANYRESRLLGFAQIREIRGRLRRRELSLPPALLPSLGVLERSSWVQVEWLSIRPHLLTSPGISAAVFGAVTDWSLSLAPS